jgi:hypothetical protein
MEDNKSYTRKKKSIKTKTSANDQLIKIANVKKEEKRLRKSYVEIKDNNVLNIIDGLIMRAAYMRIQLEIYENDLNIAGYVELFTQSEEVAPYERERPVARLYNALNKNYQSIIKQLADLVPKQTKIESDGFEEFCKE